MQIRREVNSEAMYLGVTALIALCQFLFAIEFNAVNVALASIGKDLTLSPAALSWVMSSYLLSYAGLLILGGKIGDLYGRRLPCLIGLACFGAASIGAFLAPNFPTLLIARSVEGIGCAFMIPTTLSLINVMLPPGRLRHRAFALYGASQGPAMILGLNLGGAMTTHFGWHSVFLLNLPIVVIALGLTWRFIPRGQRLNEKIGLDTAGAILVTAAIGLLLFGISESGHKGLLSQEALIGLIGAMVCFSAFGVLESRLKEPLLPLSILSHPSVAGAYLACLALAASVGMALVLLNLYMQQVVHLTATMSGVKMLPFAVAMSVTGNLLHRAMARFPLRPTILVGTLVAIIGAAMLSFAALSPSYVAYIAPAIVVFAVGSTAANITLMALGTSAAPAERQGLATGVLITCQQVGLALGMSGCLSVLNAGLTANLSLTRAFAVSFLDVGATAASGLVFIVLLTRRELASAQPPLPVASVKG